MATYFFFPAESSASSDQVAKFATGYRTTHPLPLQPPLPEVVLSDLPDLLDTASLLTGVPDQRRAGVERYLTEQLDRYGPIAHELLHATRPGHHAVAQEPSGSPADSVEFAALAEPWHAYVGGTVVGIRRPGPVGVLAVFDGWTVDPNEGRLRYEAPPPRTARSPHATTSRASPRRFAEAALAVEGDESGTTTTPGTSQPWSALGAPDNDLQDYSGADASKGAGISHTVPPQTWGTSGSSDSREIPSPDPGTSGHPGLVQAVDFLTDLLGYVGNGLAMTNPTDPLPGLTLTFFAQQFDKAAKAMDQGPSMVEQITALLNANKIQLEEDLSKTPLRTYEDWATDHYQDNWLSEILGAPDLNAPDIKQKIDTLTEFVGDVTKDLDSRNADILDAVNLLKVDDPSPSKDLMQPSEAMWKAAGWFYAANYVLAKGRQAFNAQYTLNGDAAAARIAGVLAAKSTLYVSYAKQLRKAVDDQAWNRLQLVSAKSLTGGSQVDDKYKTYDRRSEPDWDNDESNIIYDGEPCCGSDDCASKFKIAQDRMAEFVAQKGPAYRATLITWFWGNATGFDDAVWAMMQNDVLLQQTAKVCQDAAVSS